VRHHPASYRFTHTYMQAPAFGVGLRPRLPGTVIRWTPGEMSYLPHHQAPSAVVHAPAIRLLERLSSSRQRANDSLSLWLVCALRPCHKCYTTTDLISELHQGKVVSQAISTHTCVGAQQVQSLFTSQYVQLIPSPISRSRSWRTITPR
jgi:hypothetical protein